MPHLDRAASAAPAGSASDGVERWSPAPMLARLCGDEALARELAALFLATYSELMTAVHGAVHAGSLEDVRRASHALKGSLVNFTEAAPTSTAQAVERLAREGRREGLSPLVERLSVEIDRFAAQLTEFAGGIHAHPPR